MATIPVASVKKLRTVGPGELMSRGSQELQTRDQQVSSSGNNKIIFKFKYL